LGRCWRDRGDDTVGEPGKEFVEMAGHNFFVATSPLFTSFTWGLVQKNHDTFIIYFTWNNLSRERESAGVA
jgi:hypothetical protein